MRSNLVSAGLVRTAALALALAGSACATAVAPAPAHALAPAPVHADAPPIEVCWIETANADASGELATEGRTELQRWHATASALLVRHPAGDILVDAGTTPTLRDDTRELKPGARIYSRASAGRMQWRGDIPAQLRTLGVDPGALRHIVLSHVHPDHAGGVEMLPGVPVLVGRGEIDFVHDKLAARDHHVLPRQGRALQDRMVPVDLDPIPYATFDESADLFGDGRVVLVPLFGHTPGSLGTFVDLGDGRRLFHVGDVVLVQESVERSVVKGKLMQPTDVDKPRNAVNVARLAQLHALDPELEIVPAHDRDVWRRVFGETS
ncbi:MAG TPA: MBL fold metallo-hydrolase, partial [Nannocystaceae bacterium]|nr:MBL fold metallo-hydrolase [Nannocystaceae bacterium]